MEKWMDFSNKDLWKFLRCSLIQYVVVIFSFLSELLQRDFGYFMQWDVWNEVSEVYFIKLYLIYYTKDKGFWTDF